MGVESRVGQRWNKGTALAGGGEVAIHSVNVDIGHTRGMSTRNRVFAITKKANTELQFNPGRERGRETEGDRQTDRQRTSHIHTFKSKQRLK